LKNHYHSEVRKFLRKAVNYLKKIQPFEMVDICEKNITLKRLHMIIKKEKIPFTDFSFDLFQELIIKYCKCDRGK